MQKSGETTYILRKIWKFAVFCRNHLQQKLDTSQKRLNEKLVNAKISNSVFVIILKKKMKLASISVVCKIIKYRSVVTKKTQHLLI